MTSYTYLAGALGLDVPRDELAEEELTGLDDLAAVGWADLVPTAAEVRAAAIASRLPRDDGVMSCRITRSQGGQTGQMSGYLSATAARYFRERALGWIRLLVRGDEIMLRGEEERDPERRVRRIRSAHGAVFVLPRVTSWPHGTVIPLSVYGEGCLVGIPQVPQEGVDE